MAISVFIADDHGIILDGLRLLLETTGRYQVVGAAMDGPTAVEEILTLHPDLASVDRIMPGLHGTEITRQVRAHQCPTKILILSMVSDTKIIRATLAAGADGYVLKESASGELLDAIPIVLAGRRFLSPTIRDAILEAQINTPEAEAQSPFDQLGPREREILPMLVEGYTSAEIGNRLGLAASTVDTYRSRIMAKLQANSFAELIRMAIQHDIGTS